MTGRSPATLPAAEAQDEQDAAAKLVMDRFWAVAEARD
jgi:hypothetical protein